MQTFYYVTGFCDKKIEFLQICKFFSRAQEIFNDVSFVIFGHQTWDLEEDPVMSYTHKTILHVINTIDNITCN